MNIKRILAFVIIALSISCNDVQNVDIKSEGNILLQKFNTPFEVPPFNLIKDEDFLPAFNEAINIHNSEIKQILENKEIPTFENTIEAFDTCGILLEQVLNIYKAEIGTKYNYKRKEVAEEIFPTYIKHIDSVFQNEKLFKRIEVIYNKEDDLSLSIEEKTLLTKIYKKFIKTGIKLELAKREKLKLISLELSKLKLKFQNNIYNYVKNFNLIVSDSSDLKGLPVDMILIASELASQNGNNGKWQFSLNKTTYLQFLKYASKRKLREKMFTAYSNIANNNNEFDNKNVVNKIVNLRLQKAKLFGYNNYASYILEMDNRMISSTNKISYFLDKNKEIYFKKVKQTAKILQKIINEEDQGFKLQAWDWLYYSEKYMQKFIKLNNEELKPYFELENTLKGLFSAVNKMYKLKIIERKDLPVYNNALKVYEVLEENGKHIGILYFSFYAGSTNTDYIRKQFYRNNKIINPILLINCNFSQEYKSGKTFLTLQQTKNLYHEFGHALHGLLSNTKYYSTIGLNVTLDFVEFPSQYMEKYALHKENLKRYAKHFKTGEIISDELINKIQKVENFNNAFVMSERLSAAYIDMKWHTISEKKDYDVVLFEENIINEIKLPNEISPRYKSTYFEHIFNNEYSAGYYSYLWDNVLVEDAFTNYSDKSIFNEKTNNSFRKNILEKGGSIPAINLYDNFRKEVY